MPPISFGNPAIPHLPCGWWGSIGFASPAPSLLDVGICFFGKKSLKKFLKRTQKKYFLFKTSITLKLAYFQGVIGSIKKALSLVRIQSIESLCTTIINALISVAFLYLLKFF
jgi:hypothetical protein